MGLGLRTVGRAKASVEAAVDGLIDEGDLELIAGPRGADPAPAISKLRERHHALARHLAEGKTPGEAALLTRYTQSRVSILLGDPAFRDLVEHYRANVNAEFVDFQRKLSELAIDAAHVLQERLEDAPDEISDAMLLRVVEVGADRTGHGPSQKSEVNVRIGLASRLSEARARVATATAEGDISGKAPQMIDVTPRGGGDE